MAATAPAFAADPRRRALIAKVKIAQKTLGLDDDTYRAVLIDVTGKSSAAALDAAELVNVVKRFEARGFTAKPGPGKVARPKAADHPFARKARALWISLHQLGAVEKPDDSALEAFARRQLGVERMQWADQARAYKLIEALKAMGTRHGWDQDVAGIPPAHRLYALRLRHAEAIVAKLKRLKIVPAHWGVDEAAWHLCGTRRDPDASVFAMTQIDVIAAGLGRKLRQAQGKPS